MEKMVRNTEGGGRPKSVFTETRWLRKHLSHVYLGSKSDIPHLC